MKRSKSWSRSQLAALAVLTFGTLSLLAACSSDEGNATPSNPIINTGGGGGGGKTGGAAGDSSEAGAVAQGGNANGGSTPAGDAGEAGQAGAAGSNAAGEGPGGNAGASSVCPTTDLGFLNQASTSQSSSFDNDQRLGTYTTLPALQ